jgi:hypothetical protein
MRCIDALLAVDTGEVAKLNTRGHPSFLQSRHKAVDVGHVSALDHYTWCCIQTFSIANRAVFIAIFFSRGIWVLLHAIWVKTGKTFEFPSETTAIVAASEDFLA